tara:strand:+ start:664 stop:1014 length:351 start_codon:yes stop_codon:yes gene_type:complete
MSNRANSSKNRSLAKELVKGYASIPKEAAKTAKRYAKNTKQMVKDLPSMVVNDPYVKNAVMIAKDPFNLGDKAKVPSKMGGGRGKAKVARNMASGRKVTVARGCGAARPQKFGKNG